MLFYLGQEAVTNEEMIESFKEFPASIDITVVRFLCAVFLHITLNGENKQGLDMMKFANNHPWLFRNWSQAYLIGFMQYIVVMVVEIVNLVILTTNNSVMEIIMNFLALVILAEFDEYFLTTVENEVFETAIQDGDDAKIPVFGKQKNGKKKVKELADIIEVRVTSSNSARFKRKENRFNYKEDQEPDNLD